MIQYELKRVIMKKIELNGNYVVELTKPESGVKYWHISFLKKNNNGLTPVFDAPIILTQENSEMGIIQFDLDSENLFIEEIPLIDSE